MMHSHRRKGHSLRAIVSSYHRVIHPHHRKDPSRSLAVPTLYRKMTSHPGDGPTFRGECYFFPREETFFCRNESVNRRIERVHRHDEHVHSVIAHSSRSIGRTQCRKVSSPEQSGSCYPRIGSVIYRKLCVNCRIELILRGKQKAESSVARALWPWEERDHELGDVRRKSPGQAGGTGRSASGAALAHGAMGMPPSGLSSTRSVFRRDGSELGRVPTPRRAPGSG
jgi:hypothetical protein